MKYEVEKKAKLYFLSISETINFKKNQDVFTSNIKQLQQLLISNIDETEENIIIFQKSFYNLSKKKQSEVIKKLVSDLNLHQYTKECLNLILESESIDVFLYFVKYFFTLKSEHQGIQQVLIYSVVSLNPTQKKKIEKLIKNKITIPLYFEYKIDKSLLAGVKIKVSSKVYDGTLINKINRLENLLKGKYNV